MAECSKERNDTADAQSGHEWPLFLKGDLLPEKYIAILPGMTHKGSVFIELSQNKGLYRSMAPDPGYEKKQNMTYCWSQFGRDLSKCLKKYQWKMNLK